MKKIILILSLIFIVGCSQPQLGGEELKADKADILYSEQKITKNGEVIEYAYKTKNKVKEENLNYKGENLKELINERKPNARFYQNGKDNIAVIYSDSGMIKVSNDWYEVERATATITTFGNEMLGGSGDPIYSSNDGSIVSVNATWSTAMSGSSLSTSENLNIDVEKSLGDYYIQRGYMTFDTSGLGAGADITAATLSIYGSGAGGSGRVSKIVDCSSYATFDTTIWGNAGTTPQSNTAISSWNTSGYNDFVFDVLSNINPTGNSYFAHRDATYDIANSAPAVGGYHEGYSSAYAGTDHDPKLVVTYTPAPSPTSVTDSEILTFE